MDYSHSYTDAPWCWNIYLRNWVILGVNVGMVNIPAPWSIWDTLMFFSCFLEMLRCHISHWKRLVCRMKSTNHQKGKPHRLVNVKYIWTSVYPKSAYISVWWFQTFLSITYGIILPIELYFSRWLKPPTRFDLGEEWMINHYIFAHPMFRQTQPSNLNGACLIREQKSCFVLPRSWMQIIYC
jgi:hypothetical protein